MQQSNKQPYLENEVKANFNEKNNNCNGTIGISSTFENESNLSFHELYLQCLVEEDN